MTVHLQHSGIEAQFVHKQAYSSVKTWGQVFLTGKKRFKQLFEILCFSQKLEVFSFVPCMDRFRLVDAQSFRQPAKLLTG